MRFIRNNIHIFIITFLIIGSNSYAKDKDCIEAGNFGNYITGGLNVDSREHIKKVITLEKLFPINDDKITLRAKGTLTYDDINSTKKNIGNWNRSSFFNVKNGGSYNFFLNIGEGKNLKTALEGSKKFSNKVVGVFFEKGKPIEQPDCDTDTIGIRIEHQANDPSKCSGVMSLNMSDIKNQDDGTCIGKGCNDEIGNIMDNSLLSLNEKYTAIINDPNKIGLQLSDFFKCSLGEEEKKECYNEFITKKEEELALLRQQFNNNLKTITSCIRNDNIKRVSFKIYDGIDDYHYYNSCSVEHGEMIYFDDISIVTNRLTNSDNNSEETERYNYKIKKTFKAKNNGRIFFFTLDGSEPEISIPNTKYLTNGENLVITIKQYNSDNKPTQTCRLKKRLFNNEGFAELNFNKNQKNLGIDCAAGHLNNKDKMKFIFSISKENKKDKDEYYYGEYEVSVVAKNSDSYIDILNIRGDGESFLKSTLKEIDGYIPFKKSYNKDEFLYQYHQRINSTKKIDKDYCKKNIDECNNIFNKYCGTDKLSITNSVGNNNKEIAWDYNSKNGWVKDGNICKYDNSKNNNIGLVKKIYTGFIKNDVFRNSINLILVLSVIFYTISLFTGSSDLSRQEMINKMIRFSIVVVFLHPDLGFTWFNEIFIYSFKAGLSNLSYSIFNSLTLTSSINHNSSDMAMSLFQPHGLNTIFNGTFIFKLSALLFTYPLGTFSLILIVIPALSMYLYTFFYVMMVYFTTHLTISLMFIMAPIFLAAALYESTKSMIDSWISNLFSFAAQQITLLVTFKFFDGIVIFLLKNAFFYESCQSVLQIFTTNFNVFKIEELSISYAYKFLLLYIAIFIMKGVIIFVNSVVSDIFSGFKLGSMAKQSIGQIQNAQAAIKNIGSNMGLVTKQATLWGTSKIGGKNMAKRVERAMDIVSYPFDDKKTTISDYIKGGGPLDVINKINKTDLRSLEEIKANKEHQEQMNQLFDDTNKQIAEDIKNNKYKYYKNPEARENAKKKIINDNIKKMHNLTNKEKENMRNALMKNNKKLLRGSNMLERGYQSSHLQDNQVNINNKDSYYDEIRRSLKKDYDQKKLEDSVEKEIEKNITAFNEHEKIQEMKEKLKTEKITSKQLGYKAKIMMNKSESKNISKNDAKAKLEKIRDAFKEREDNKDIEKHIKKINETLNKPKNQKR